MFTRHRCFTLARACQLVVLILLCTTVSVVAQTINQFPGGWVENQGTFTRARYTDSQIQSFVPPSRGPFTFPSPYNTKAVRITDASDCGGADCVAYVGYSYWRNTNAHEGSNDMLIFLGLNTARGGSGMTLFRLNKTTDAITKVGPLFPAGTRFNSHSGNGWYFSARLPTKLYLPDGPRMLRYDVISKTFQTVFDITAQYGSNRNIYQLHSSNNDIVHSATLQVTNTGEYLGCLVYNETTRQFSFFARQGTFDECHIDKSGRYLMIHQNIDGQHDTENVFIDLQTGARATVYDQNGGLGHSDMGFGYALGADNFNPLPNAIISYDFAPTLVSKGPAMFRSTAFGMAQIGHVSHQNAHPSLPMNRQFACGSNVNRTSIQNEVLCFRLDTSQDQLVVAPVMADLDAPGGGSEYAKYPKGNLDISGKYYIWTTNLGGNRLDAFLVKVPSHLLVTPGDTTVPQAPRGLRVS